MYLRTTLLHRFKRTFPLNTARRGSISYARGDLRRCQCEAIPKQTIKTGSNPNESPMCCALSRAVLLSACHARSQHHHRPVRILATSLPKVKLRLHHITQLAHRHAASKEPSQDSATRWTDARAEALSQHMMDPKKGRHHFSIGLPLSSSRKWGEIDVLHYYKENMPFQTCF